MKYVKMLGLAAVAAMALAAFAGAGTASATELCSTNTSPCSGTKYLSGTKVAASLKTGTTAVLTAGFGSVSCTKSSMAGSTSTNGSATETVKGSITSLTFEGCTGPFGESCTNPKAEGLPYAAEIHATGGGNGTLTVSGAKVVVECGFTVNCRFSVATASLTVTGGNPNATAAASKIALTPESIPGHENCPTSATWTATYTVTAPSPLFVV